MAARQLQESPQGKGMVIPFPHDKGAWVHGWVMGLVASAPDIYLAQEQGPPSKAAWPYLAVRNQQ